MCARVSHYLLMFINMRVRSILLLILRDLRLVTCDQQTREQQYQSTPERILPRSGEKVEFRWWRKKFGVRFVWAAEHNFEGSVEIFQVINMFQDTQRETN